MIFVQCASSRHVDVSTGTNDEKISKSVTNKNSRCSLKVLEYMGRSSRHTTAKSPRF